MKSKNLAVKLILVTIFAIAMAYLEAAVVVYLREIFSITSVLPTAQAVGKPDIMVNLGVIAFLKFSSAFKILSNSKILFIEIGREAATIIMLSTIAWIAGKKLKDKLAYFLWIFAVWDIFYYIWLYLIIKWPPSILTIDVLFLIPCPWVAPVILPLAISVLMIATAIWLLLKNSKQKIIK
jgi:hypothetical protein